MSKHHPFRFGVINEQMKAPAAWFDHVRRIEALGYSTLLLRDHFVPDFFGDQYAPLPALMAAAGVTTTLRLGGLSPLFPAGALADVVLLRMGGLSPLFGRG